MRNLAGDDGCDSSIRDELEAAGIEIVKAEERSGDEVNARLTGKLGPFTFSRAWYYWRVRGPMPLAAAEAIYANPIGKRDVRAGGDAGCPEPRAWVGRRSRSGGIVESYHVDSAAGLRLLVDTIRAAGLAS